MTFTISKNRTKKTYRRPNMTIRMKNKIVNKNTTKRNDVAKKQKGQQSRKQQRGGKIKSSLPTKYFQENERGFKFGEDYYTGKYYNTSKCVDDMCSPEELSTACMNSLGIVTLEQQDYTDYRKVMELYNRLSKSQQEDIVETNLLSLKTYMADIFKNSQAGKLDEASSMELRALLEVINPFYYNYLVFTNKLPEEMRDTVYNEMIKVRELRGPLDLMKLFLSYYNTINPYRMRSAYESEDMAGVKLNQYMYNQFRIKEMSPSVGSGHRYTPLNIWDMEGVLDEVVVPMDRMAQGSELGTVIKETYGDTFKRPNPLWVFPKKGAPGEYVDMRLMDEVGLKDDVDEYASRAQIRIFSLLMEKVTGSMPSETFPEELMTYIRSPNEEPPAADTPLGSLLKSPLVRKVYAMLGISIYYRFMNVFQVGSLGGSNFEDTSHPIGINYGLFGYFSTMKASFEQECGFIHLKNPSDDFKVNVGEAAAIRAYLKEKAPFYLKRYADSFLVEPSSGGDVDLEAEFKGNRPDSLRVIRLQENEENAVSLAIYEASLLMTDAGEYMRMAIVIEVNTYRNMNNEETPMEIITNFCIIWRNRNESEGTLDFENNCTGLNDMLMRNVWKSQKTRGSISEQSVEKAAPGSDLGSEEEKGVAEEKEQLLDEEEGVAEEKGVAEEEGVAEEKEEDISKEEEDLRSSIKLAREAVEEKKEESKDTKDEVSLEEVDIELPPEDGDSIVLDEFGETSDDGSDTDTISDEGQDIVDEEFVELPRPDLPDKSPFASNLKKPGVQTKKNRGFLGNLTGKNKTKKVRISDTVTSEPNQGPVYL